MELILDAFSYYAIFCITTVLCIMWLQIKAIRTAQLTLGMTESFVYYATTIVLVTALAPIFFLIFIFRSENYYKNIVEYIRDNYS
jgi:hypothetical protein